MARAIKLIDAPVGLFEVDGVLVLKTEYSTRHVDGTTTPDCYIVESGEHFWGGVDSVEERNNLMVTPVEMPTLTPPNELLTIEQLREMDGEPVWVELYQAWALVEVKQNGSIMFYGNSFSCSYSRTWHVYRFRPDRRPPEGEA